jgi:hypothetical protein
MPALPTAVLAAAALLFTVLCGWRGAVRPKALAAPRLVPWRALMLGSFLAMVMLLGHLVALYRGG